MVQSCSQSLRYLSPRLYVGHNQGTASVSTNLRGKLRSPSLHNGYNIDLILYKRKKNSTLGCCAMQDFEYVQRTSRLSKLQTMSSSFQWGGAIFSNFSRDYIRSVWKIDLKHHRLDLVTLKESLAVYVFTFAWPTYYHSVISVCIAKLFC